mmetsp:Transcript_12530/g.27051  ORF Transcript_12530/g.27051 Transcript_12530/m.27051 type:complete len:80 (-) Transcript_12530:32-271(-)
MYQSELRFQRLHLWEKMWMQYATFFDGGRGNMRSLRGIQKEEGRRKEIRGAGGMRYFAYFPHTIDLEAGDSHCIFKHIA